MPFVAMLLLLLLLCSSARASDGVDPTKISLPKGPGSIEGLASADLSPSMSTGAASYDIAISVPPASAGFGPQLSLAYDSGGGLTEIGIGWRLSGVPKLRRRFEDGLPRFDETDTFELVGLGIPSPLVEIDTNLFRPSFEDGSFVRVQRAPDGATWEVRTKAGPIYLFGGDGFVEAEGKHVAAYLLREQRDRHGHVISYSWDTSDGHALLTDVVWNAFDAASQNEVRLEYEARPDGHRAFSSGILEDLTRRLKGVTVLHGGSLARRYELAYGDEEHPTLRSVELIGSDGKTRMPASRFEYTKAELDAARQGVVTMQHAPGQTTADADVALADLDGDALPDLLVGVAGRFRSYINDDGVHWDDAKNWGSASPSVSLSTNGVQLADVDADGAADLVVKSGKDSFRYFPGASGEHFGPPVPIESVPGFSFEDDDVRIADMDGDRRADVIVTTEAGIAIAYNLNGTDWTEPAVVGTVQSEGDAVRFSDGRTSLCDVNGDRVMDLCSLRSLGMTYWLGRGRGQFEGAAPAMGVPEFDPSSPYRLIDLNGDGWVDLVRVSATQLDYAIATGEGVFGALRTISDVPGRGPKTQIEFADMNASGTTDVVWIDVTGDGAAAWRYLELFPAGRGGLLSRVDNGLGKVQTIEYGAAALEASRARHDGSPWSSRSNMAMPVVVRSSVDLSLGDPPMVTEWSYRDGVYDPRERTFAGFTGAVRRQAGDDATPTLLTEDTFDSGLTHRELRGVVLTEETRDATGNVFTRTTNTYTSRTSGSGRDAPSYSFKSAVRTDEVEGDPSSARTLLSETDQDDYGNVTLQRAWGEIKGDDAFVGNDEAMAVRTYANDPDEWLLGFVATEELTDGNGKRVALDRRFYDGDPMRGLPLGQVTRGDVSREEQWVGPGSDKFELVIATRYDADGQPIETTDGRGGGRYFEWAPDHTSIRSERVKLDGDVLLVEKADVDGALGTLRAATDYAGQTTRYEYDPFGRLASVVKPGDSMDAPTVAYSYDAQAPLSRVITETRVVSAEAATERSEVLFDGAGRKRGTLTRDGDRWILAGVSLFDARGNSRRVLLPRAVDVASHDAPPLLDSSPRGSDAFRDALGREIRTRSPSGIESRTVYAALEVLHYDGGQSDAASSFEHTPVIERKDGLGRVVEHVRTLGGALVSARYTYDAGGDLLSRTDPEGNVSTYAYDGRGRRTVVRDSDAGEHQFTYDATGNVIERRFPDGVVARFGFDLAGRSISEDWDGDGTPEIVRTWDQAPDGSVDTPYRGRLARITEPTGYVEHAYDARGRVTSTRYEIAGVGYVVQSDYDAQDREIRHTYPDGTSIAIRRNARGQIAGYGTAVDFTYGDDGLETERRLSTGARVVTTYDDERRRSELTASGPSGSIIEHLRWAYDSAGNLTAVKDLRSQIGRDRDRSEAYTYDNFYRLVGVEGTWGHTSYRYSPSGNLLSRASTLPEQQLIAVTYGERPHLPSIFGAHAVVADERGRFTSDGVREYTWDAADQLVKVARADGASVESTFGADGARRVRVERRAGGNVTTTHFIDDWSEVTDGKLTRYIVHAGHRIVRLADGEGSIAGAPAGEQRPRSTFRGVSQLLLALSLLLTMLLAWFCRKSIRFATVATLVLASAAALCLLAGCTHDRRSPTVDARPAEVEKLRDGDTFIVTDLLGSVLDETTMAGDSKAEFATYPFGATRYDTTHSTWKYASSPRDGAVGLDHMGARFYAPDLGIWTSPDPVATTNPTKLVTAEFGAANPYAYANQTPLIATDRDGRFANIVVGALLGALAGAAGEAVTQYLDHGKIESPGRIGAAAAAGAITGTIMAIAPSGKLVPVVANIAIGMTRRLIESHGKSVGSLRDILLDGATGFMKAGSRTIINRVIGGVTGKLGPGTGPLSRVEPPSLDQRRVVTSDSREAVAATEREQTASLLQERTSPVRTTAAYGDANLSQEPSTETGGKVCSAPRSATAQDVSQSRSWDDEARGSAVASAPEPADLSAGAGAM